MIEYLAAVGDVVAQMRERELMATIVFSVVMAAVSLAIYVGLRRRNYDRNSRIFFDDLVLAVNPITGKKELDPARCMLMGGFLIDALVLLYLVMRAQAVPDGISVIYGIFTAAIVAPAVTVVLKTKVMLPGQSSPPENAQ